MSILKDLYDGSLNPFEHAVSREKEYRTLGKKIVEERERLIECLPDEERNRFEAWDQDVMKIGTMAEYAKFAYGYRMGVLLMCEVMFAEGKTSWKDS